MKALFIQRFAREKSYIAIVLLSVIMSGYPHNSAFAFGNQSTEQNTASVFEIKSSQAENSLKYNSIVESDPLVKNLEEYLNSYDSPLAPYAKEMVQQPQWKRALAISWVESNFCIHHKDRNCSGIGVAPGHPSWRKYQTHLDWFKDMCQLMETPRYKEKYTTFEKMRGIYVYPGSDNWVNGSKQKFAELSALEMHSEQEKQFAILNSQTQDQNRELAQK